MTVNSLEAGKASSKNEKGYSSLAALIASDHTKSTSIYRRFDRLAARNLLYLQSDLAELETRQDALDAEDFRASTVEKESARNWETLKDRAENGGHGRDKIRLEVALKIREKLKEYRSPAALTSVSWTTNLTRRGSHSRKHICILKAPVATNFACFPECFPQRAPVQRTVPNPRWERSHDS